MALRFNRIQICLAFLLGAALNSATAHVTDTCLLLVKQSAQSLKSCVEKKESEECSELRHLLSIQISQCQEELYSNADIQQAILEGEKLVEGSARYMLNPQVFSRASTTSRMVRGNNENFTRQFDFVKAFPMDDLNAGVNEGGCYKAFLARHDRYEYAGHLSAKRFDDTKPDVFQSYRVYYFVPMKAGICYAIPKEDESLESGDLLVINLPEEFFRYLLRSSEIEGIKALVEVCDSRAECTKARHHMETTLLEYNKAYAALKRLLVCENDSSSSVVRRSARLLTSKDETPAYCEDETIPLKIEQGRSYLDKLARQLFES